MKNKLLFTSLSILVVIFGVLAGIKAASQSNGRQFTLHQETRDGSGNLLWTDVHIHDNGRDYWQHTDAVKGFSETWILNEHGGFHDAVDPDNPRQFYRVRNAGKLLVMPDSLREWGAFTKQPGFLREAEYKGYRCAVFSDGESEKWMAQEFWPKPLRIVAAGKTTETVEISGSVDVGKFEVKQ